VLQYFISTHGARKGLADTALKTADSGYLTRRLVDVAQDVIINERDCGTTDGIYVEPIIEAGVEVEPLRDRIVGAFPSTRSRTSTGTVIVDVSQEITEELANQVQGAGIERVRIRSVLTCESRAAFARFAMAATSATAAWLSLAKPSASSPLSPSANPHAADHAHFPHRRNRHTRVSERSTLEARNNGVVSSWT